MSIPLNLLKSAALSIPHTREMYFRREFLKRIPSCKGIYRSFAQASADSPADKLAGYNHASIPQFYKAKLGVLNPADYPVLFWLSQLLPAAQFVFELGGSIGSGYYSYRKYLPFPARLRWTICELPETVRAGEEIAREKNESQLAFTEQRQLAENADLYTTFGALQYIEEPFAEIIGNLRARPVHLLINRVPFCEGPPFITLQNNGEWFSPYKADNRSRFIESIQALDYDLVDTWEVTRVRANRFLTHTEATAPQYYGMYFRLK